MDCESIPVFLTWQYSAVRVNAVQSAVRAAIVQSYLDRRESLPAWIAQPVIWHLGLLRRFHAERAFQAAQQPIARKRRR